MSESAPLSPPGFFAQVRAALIAIVVPLTILQAVPSKPIKIAELMGVERTLGIGVRDAIWQGSRMLTRTRKALIAPFDPLYDKLGMGQNWRLFTVRGRNTFRIQIEAMREDDQAFRTVYRAHDVDELGLASELTYRRLRGIFDPRNKEDAPAQYDAFVKWMSKRILDQHPEYVGVRVSMEHLRLHTPSRPTELTSVEHVNEVFREGTP